LSVELDRYAVVGNPIAHSRSPEIHAQFAQQTKQLLRYERLLAPFDGFAETIAEFSRQGGKGLNVTVPFKLEAYTLATSLTARAETAGAVNTLFWRDDQLWGDNTDGAGLVTDLNHNAGVTIADRRILLLGAGGAARGVMLPLLQMRPAQLTVANRTSSKAIDLAQLFSSHGKVAASEYEQLQGRFDIVINATSASLGHDLPPVPETVFSEGTFAYDMMYGGKQTVFMEFAAKHGAAIRDGLGMLIEQAAESFFLWRGIRPDTGPVHAALRRQLIQSAEQA